MTKFYTIPTSKAILGILMLFLMGMSINSVQAQVPTWDWAISSDCYGADYPRAIVADGAGNTYITGTFDGPMTIDTLTITPEGLYDAFLAKLNTSGEIQWAVNVGGSNNETGLSIALDPFGNVFLGGVFNSNSMVVGTDTLYSNGWTHDALFLVKFDGNGNPLWARSSEGPGTQGDALQTLAADSDGNIYGAGFFKSDSISMGGTYLINQGLNDMHMFKLDPDGEHIWSNSYGSEGEDFGYRMGIDNSNNLYLGGWFGSDTLIVGGDSLFNAGEADVFLGKFTSSGTPVWGRQSTGIDNENILGLGMDLANDRVFATGRYSSTAVFGTDSLENQGGMDMFLVVYDTAGNMLWYENRGTALDDQGRGVSVNQDGGAIVVGTFAGDTLWIGTEWVANKGGTDMFLAKYSMSGGLDYLKGMGGNGIDNDPYITTDTLGNAFLLAVYTGATVSLDSLSLTNPGDRTIFIAKISTTYVGIFEGFQVEQIGLYPNPTVNGTFYIRATSENNAIQGYKLMDITGSVISEKKIWAARGEAIEVHVNGNGVYIIQVEMQDGSMQQGRIVNLR